MTTVPLKAPDGSPRRVTTRFTSHLALPPGDGGTKARVTLNGARTDVTDNAEPFTHQVMGRTGDNTVEASILGNPHEDGVWRFDFRNAPGFEASSFVVESGQLVSQQPRQIVFRVGPGARRVRFRYRLSGQP